MKSLTNVSPKNNEIIVAFLDLIDTGIAHGYTLREFRNFIEREQRPACGMCESGYQCEKHV